MLRVLGPLDILVERHADVIAANRLRNDISVYEHLVALPAKHSLVDPDVKVPRFLLSLGGLAFLVELPVVVRVEKLQILVPALLRA